MDLYLLKIIRLKWSYMRLLLREQERVWDGDRACPRMVGSNLCTQKDGQTDTLILKVLKLLKQTVLQLAVRYRNCCTS